MNLVLVYARLYGDCFRKAFRGIGKNLWTLLLPIALLFVWIFLPLLLAPLGIVGGLLMGLAEAAIFSCYLYFVGEIVSNAKVSVTEFRRSIGKYFWSVVNVLFIIWIADLVSGPFIKSNRQAPLIYALLEMALFILLNTTPEVIYWVGTYGGLATLQRSLAFTQQNWIEWFIPNLLFVAAGYYALPLILILPFGQILAIIVGGALLHVLFVFRGYLFEALDGSSHRQRMFRYRNGMD